MTMSGLQNGPFYDVAIIGGGINGCGIARDAAGRGLSVYLCERDDLASATSSASTKLIHGGLRYLEHMKFRLVRESLSEREVLLRVAPHIIRPMRFVLPCVPGMRPAWLLRLGLFLYDTMGGRKFLPAARSLNLGVDPSGIPLIPGHHLGFEYSDCWVEDARLVVLNARDASARGAAIETRARCTKAVRELGGWSVSVVSCGLSSEKIVRAKVLVNASGPWVNDIISNTIQSGVETSLLHQSIRMIRGSHIVVPRIFDHEKAYILQNSDGRIVFAIPFESNFTLIGTTEEAYSGDPADVRCTGDEIEYLCLAVSRYFRCPVRPADVIWTYSGVRPLYDDGAPVTQAITRDYVLRVDAVSGSMPVLHVFGGKITTYRKLAEAALDRLRPFFPRAGKPWTAHAHLPGGDFEPGDFENKVSELSRDYPFLDRPQAARLFRAYGTCVRMILGDASSRSDLGEDFGAGLTAREVSWMIRNEWACNAQDVLWRRSRLGLRLGRDQVGRLDEWIRNRYPSGA